MEGENLDANGEPTGETTTANENPDTGGETTTTENPDTGGETTENPDPDAESTTSEEPTEEGATENPTTEGETPTPTPSGGGEENPDANENPNSTDEIIDNTVKAALTIDLDAIDSPSNEEILEYLNANRDAFIAFGIIFDDCIGPVTGLVDKAKLHKLISAVGPSDKVQFDLLEGLTRSLDETITEGEGETLTEGEGAEVVE